MHRPASPFARTTGNAARTVVLAASLLLAAALLTSCGYHATGEAGPNVFQGKAKTIYLAGVDNRTPETWLGPRLRGVLRDELTRRGYAQWTERDQADSIMHITVQRYYRKASVRGTDDETLRYSASMDWQVRITARDGSLIWDSGMTGISRDYYFDAQTELDKTLTDLAAREMADRMTQAY